MIFLFFGHYPAWLLLYYKLSLQTLPVDSTWSVCRVALIKQKEYKSIDDLYYLKIKIICMRRQ